MRSRTGWAVGVAVFSTSYALAVWLPHHSVTHYAACQSMFSPAAWFANGCAHPIARVAILALGALALGASIAVGRMNDVGRRGHPTATAC